jgi:hypothetical protein
MLEKIADSEVVTPTNKKSTKNKAKKEILQNGKHFLFPESSSDRFHDEDLDEEDIPQRNC